MWSLGPCLKFQGFVFCPLQKAEVPFIEIECLVHFPVLVEGHLAQPLEQQCDIKKNLDILAFNSHRG